MKALVEQLRKGAMEYYLLEYRDMMTQAADAIEALESKCDQMHRAGMMATESALQYQAELAALREQKPCASISHCSLYGAEDCTCSVVGPCERLTDVYLAAGAKP